MKAVFLAKLMFSSLMGSLFASSDLSQKLQENNGIAKKYEVFINHTGFDPNNSLAHHIYDLLEHRGIPTFFDIEEMISGKPETPQILSAIKSSRVQIAIISPTYGESTGCLEELVLMMQEHRNDKSVVIPIFYHVEPYEVRYLKTKFGEAFYNKHLGVETPEKVELWKKALEDVSELSGYLWSQYLGSLAKVVVYKVCTEVSCSSVDTSDKAFGMADLLIHTKSKIASDLTVGKVTCLEISGAGGIGKTTFARDLSADIRSAYDKFCFIEDAKGIVEKDGIVQLQSMLLLDLFGKEVHLSNPSQGREEFKKNCQGDSILLVLDNLDHETRLSEILFEDNNEDLLKNMVIIVTTSDARGVLKSDEHFPHHANPIQVEIPALSFRESKDLFCSYAFETNDSKFDAKFENPVTKIVEICRGIPLLLVLYGRHLYRKDFAFWEVFWNNTTKKINPNTHLLERLQVCYDSLDTELEKQLFLDIAIFFHGEEERSLRSIREEEDEGRYIISIDKLERKLLIRIESGRIYMHDVLRDLAKDIVDKEGELNPGSRSRLWRPKDVRKVLTGGDMGTNKVEGLSLISQGLVVLDEDDNGDPCPWNVDAFASVSSLQVLKLRGNCIAGDLSELPKKLLYLSWREFPQESIGMLSLKFVRVLDLSNGNQTALWDSNANAPANLRELKLHGCSKLQKLPEMSKKFRYLKHVDLSDCSSLQTIPESFGSLKGLEYLNLSGCIKLECLPDALKRLKNLKELKLP